MSGPSVFESFNARALEPHQVASSFIPSEHYDALARRQHSLVVGPRGSGKTTLLKMLQPQALEVWRHPSADRVRKSIDFTGVFVPSDITWERQLQSLDPSDNTRPLAHAAFTTHVLRALVSAFEFRAGHPIESGGSKPFRRVKLSPERQARAAQELAGNWQLQLSIDGFAGVRHALTARLAQIRILSMGGDSDSGSVPAWLRLPFLEASAMALDVFEQATGTGRERWALLFDELELAPKRLRDELFQSLRSVEDRLLFKLSMSPFTKDFPDDHLSPMAGQDFGLISLSYPNKESSYEFSEAIVQQMLKEKGFDSRGLSDVLAPSILDAGNDAKFNKNRQRAILQRLAKNDAGFAEHLASKRIDLEKPATYSSKDPRAIEVRKVAHVAIIREAFAQNGEPRARKNPGIYHGATALFAIVEGNPRWLIGMMTELLRGFDGAPVDAARQSAEIQKATNRFRALLRTIPLGDLPGRGALGILDPIGEYFKNAVLFERFSSDPPTTFVVDSDANSSLTETLGRALNAGALVYVPDKDSGISVSSLRGKRFRLSFLLAAHYCLPLQLGRSVPLSRVMYGAGRDPGQKGLFDREREGGDDA